MVTGSVWNTGKYYGQPGDSMCYGIIWQPSRSDWEKLAKIWQDSQSSQAVQATTILLMLWMTIEPQERAWHAVEACKWYRMNAYNTVNDHSITKGHGMQWRPINWHIHASHCTGIQMQEITMILWTLYPRVPNLSCNSMPITLQMTVAPQERAQNVVGHHEQGTKTVLVLAILMWG